MSGDWFLTFTGKKFYPVDPRLEDICIEDIARSLSNQCRFAGHVMAGFYSVAQHSLIVSREVPREHALWGLLHDAAEAYCQDIIRPLKKHPDLEGYRHIEARLEAAIAARFQLPLPMPACVKEADDRALMTERRDLLANQKSSPWSCKAEPFPDRIVPMRPEYAEAGFLGRFKELTGGSR